MLNVHLEMVLQILSYPGQIVDGLDPLLFEEPRVADARQLHQLRSINRAGCQNDLPTEYPLTVAFNSNGT